MSIQFLIKLRTPWGRLCYVILQLRKLLFGEFIDLHEFTKLVSMKFLSQCLVYREHFICTYWMKYQICVFNSGWHRSPCHRPLCWYCLTLNCRMLFPLWGTVSLWSSVLIPKLIALCVGSQQTSWALHPVHYIFCGLQIQDRFLCGPEIKGTLAPTLFLKILCARGGRGIRKMTFKENM